MKWIDHLDLGPDAFQFSYRLETRNEHWSIQHAHQGIELLYVHEGIGEVTIDNRQFPIQSGTLLCLQPYQIHKVEVAPRENGSYIRSNVTFEPRILESYLAPYPKLHGLLRHMWKGTLDRQVFSCESSRLPELLGEYKKLKRRGEGEVSNEDRALFLLTLLRHLQLHIVTIEEEREATANGTGHMERILDWIEAHYAEPFELQRLANELHLSPYHISHLFKKHTGSSLSAYIAVRRVREACMLLANTDLPIGDVARAAGSFSIPYFCSLFKKHKGVSPQTYRASLRRLYRDGGDNPVD